MVFGTGLKKKIWPALLLLCAALCGCGAQEEESTEVSQAPAQRLAPQDGMFAFETIRNGELVHVGPTATPTPSPTPLPTPTPDPVTEAVAEAQPPGAAKAYDISQLQAKSYTAEQLAQIEAFYANTLFTGDSVLLGFKNYCAKSSDPMCKNFHFLAAGSYSLHNAFWEVSSKSVHPLYQGQQYPLWESVPMIAPDRIFMFFGINDVSFGVDDSLALYPQLIEKLTAACPGLEINILSTTYTLAGAGKGGLNNDNIALFNKGTKQLALDNGWGYVDLATLLSDGEGNLAEKYCSDGELHENSLAYDVWVMALRAYAAERLGF